MVGRVAETCVRVVKVFVESIYPSLEDARSRVVVR